MSAIGERVVPDLFVRREQRRIRLLPLFCLMEGFYCGLGLLGLMVFLLSRAPLALACCGIMLLLWGPSWVWNTRAFGESCRNQPGWSHLLLKYHVIGYFGIGVPAAVLCSLLVEARFVCAHPAAAIAGGLFAVLMLIIIRACFLVLRRLGEQADQLQEGFASEQARRRYRERLAREPGRRRRTHGYMEP
jgi:hypothetical protein